jgi:hypothetical protein
MDLPSATRALWRFLNEMEMVVLNGKFRAICADPLAEQVSEGTVTLNPRRTRSGRADPPQGGRLAADV